ncbi:MAG: hypothetical protein ACI4FX_09180 [Agathobacter sp.]
MKKCAYCGEILGSPLHVKTDEHIIPDSLLKLYPEQDISIHNTSRFVDNRGMTISDVCSSCNNGILSELDSYGKQLIESSFYIPYKFNDYYIPFDVTLNYELFTRWILKIVYNSLRCDKHDSFYINECIPYIMGKNTSYPKNISLLLGIHINLNPMPEECFAFTPLQIMYSPQFFQNSYMRVEKGEEIERFILRGAGQVVSMRIANVIVLLVLWKSNVSDEHKKEMITTLQDDFRFRLIEPDVNRYSVRCVSSPTNVMAANYGHFYSETAVSEIISLIKDSLRGRDIGVCLEEFSKIWTPEMSRHGRALVEAAEFPNNKKKQKILDDLTYLNKKE